MLLIWSGGLNVDSYCILNRCIIQITINWWSQTDEWISTCIKNINFSIYNETGYKEYLAIDKQSFFKLGSIFGQYGQLLLLVSEWLRLAYLWFWSPGNIPINLSPLTCVIFTITSPLVVLYLIVTTALFIIFGMLTTSRLIMGKCTPW